MQYLKEETLLWKMVLVIIDSLAFLLNLTPTILFYITGSSSCKASLLVTGGVFCAKNRYKLIERGSDIISKMSQ